MDKYDPRDIIDEPRVVSDPVINEVYKASDDEVFDLVFKKLVSCGYKKKEIIRTPMYLYARGKENVALVAHADTVFFKKPETIMDYGGVMFSSDLHEGLGGDDRSGVYIILRLLDLGHRPHVLLTTEEEIGCIGARKFSIDFKAPDGLVCLVEFDRHGGDEAVYYGCENKDFEKFIVDHGFKTEIGRFSDIGVIAPAWGIAAVNLSIGVHDEHTANEHVIISEVEEIISKSTRMLRDMPKKPWKYVEKNGYKPYLPWWFDDDDVYKPRGKKKESARRGRFATLDIEGLEGGIIDDDDEKPRGDFWESYFDSFRD